MITVSSNIPVQETPVDSCPVTIIWMLLFFQALKHDLESTRDSEKETTMDKIHKENVRQGRDKYKTLREIRKGNTKRRVDQFENL